MNDLHAIIVAGDKTVTPLVEHLTGKEMLLYKMRQAKGDDEVWTGKCKKSYVAALVTYVYVTQNI